MTMTTDSFSSLGAGTGMFAIRGEGGEAPPVEASPEEGQARSNSKTPSVNKYAGPCIYCEQTVEPGEGFLAGKANDRWLVRHATDQCPEAPEVLSAEAAEADPRFDVPEVHPGTYTLETDNGHRTFRVWLQARDEEFAPGKTILQYLVGQDNESDYQSFAFIEGGRLHVWKKFRDGGNTGLVRDAEAFMADPTAALVARHCLRCNAVLTTPESVERGLGPVCAQKGW